MPIRKLRASRIRARVRSFAGPGIEGIDEDQIRVDQLRRLNVIWSNVCNSVPHFASMCLDEIVPKEFRSFKEFQGVVPVLSRDELRNQIETFSSPNHSRDQIRSTGGSTAEPIRFPVCKAEINSTADAAWWARSWVGIDSADSLFLLWGHSHLFGSGWKGWVNRQKRLYSDRILGYCRYSAYDLSEPALDAAAICLLDFRPRWCLGYSVAWDRFADVNWNKRARIRNLGIKAVIATAEAFPHSESRKKIEELFDCPVLMEYGSVETGIIAQEVSPGQYRVVWQNHLLEVVENRERVGELELIVTSLFPRCLSLIRYKIGDYIQGACKDHSILRFSSVGGRCNDFLELRSGKRIHSEAISHVLRDLDGVKSFQAVQNPLGTIMLKLILKDELSSNLRETIVNRLSKLDPILADTTIEKVSELERSVAGKTPTIVRR